MENKKIKNEKRLKINKIRRRRKRDKYRNSYNIK